MAGVADNFPVTARLGAIARVAIAGLLTASCASTGGTPRPFPTPGERPPTDAERPDLAEIPAPGEDRAADPDSPPGPVDGFLVAGMALQFRGTPYRYGGASPDAGFDCSGLVQYVFGQYGVAVPRDVSAQYRFGSRIGIDAVRPGDLLFFAIEGRDASHVAIAISSRQFVHAPNSNGVVRVEALNSNYWEPRYLGARRVLGD